MNRVLIVIGVVAFATALPFRAVDPVIPLIARDFAVAPSVAALLSTGFALPFALGQPVLGPIADMIRKTRIMTGCVLVAVVAALIGAFAQNFTLLLGSRVIAGAAAGGIFPIALAIAGDLVPMKRRQVVIGRLLAASLFGNLLGASAGGVIGDAVGWRGIFALLASSGAFALAGSVFGFRGTVVSHDGHVDWSSAMAGYRRIFASPLAGICYAAVFVEGLFVFGLFPFVASLLSGAGEERSTIAGLVLSGFGMGGVLLSISVPILLRGFSERSLMLGGGLIAAMALLTVAVSPWWLTSLMAFIALGVGFYMLHTCIQVHTTELAPGSRGSAMALHSLFFFLGQAVGPVIYGYGFKHAAVLTNLGMGAMAMGLVGAICARHLRYNTQATP